jgi:electron transfer flavoprotein-quinone oxidoreductase
MPDVDVIVVGGGPAGACAALTLARAGRDVVVFERGPFPGSKNMYGGVVYPRVLDALLPNWWAEAPIQRWVTRRSTMLMTGSQAVAVDYRTRAWGTAPYNGATAYRPEWDAWLARRAEAEGARVVCATTVTGLLRDGARVLGVRTDRLDGELTARVVIACDGVNSFVAKEAGLYHHTEPEHFTVGVKETLALPKDVIDERFAVRGRDGVDIEMLGCTGGVPGGGFLYTNLDTLGVGVVLSVPALAAQQLRPEEIIAGLKAHPAIEPLVEGGEMKEYSAHLIPEGGFEMMPELGAPGLLIAGDAAAFCLAAGIWLEGVNFAMGSGMVAGQVVDEAMTAGVAAGADLPLRYRRALGATFVLKDHRRLRRAPNLVLSRRVQEQYPAFIANAIERVFRVDNPDPKPGLARILREEQRRAGLGVRDIVRDGWEGWRAYG